MSTKPVPGDPGRDESVLGWEPVITRPDPMTAEEWEVLLEHDLAEDLDPEELQYEDDFLNPDADLTEAELAEIADAMQARAADAAGAAGVTAGADPAGVARVLAAQAAAASAKRRGPWQPGSQRPLAGESSSPAAGFGTGQLLDVMAACPDLAILADRAAGDGDSYQGASDDELIGVLCAWDRLEAHMAARKLAAITELSRRRPVLEAPSSGRPDGVAGEDFTADELAHVLAESRHKAGGLLTLAGSLDTKLPGTKAAQRDGVITLAKAQIISNATTVLNAKEAQAAEEQVLGRAGRLTPEGLREAIARAVMDVAPKKAKKRREHAAKSARVERWGEDSGNGALAGRELPPAGVLAADHRITWWARQLKKAGLDGDMDQLRARAYLDLLCGTDSRPGTTPRHPGAAAGQDGPAHPAGLVPAGFATRGTLTIPLATLLDLADRPGQLSGTPIDPWLARDLARAAAASPKTSWCVTATDPDGHAIWHACAGPAPKNHSKHARPARRGKRGGPGPPGTAAGPDRPGPGFSFTRTSRDGPPGSPGTWTLTIHGREYQVTFDPLATESCDHRHEASGHDPGVKLRHLAQIRHATCTGPICRRPASQCDFEHNTPYEAGGRTCLCNAGPKCRHDHRVKQDPRWKVEQRPDGTFAWTTPSGRTYTTEPTRYPI
ncbi:MAG TPA: DUF222 domain-containing protein [Streptosporangiaceae bacterium]|nr:DUF222 domain-containing protein [Streptosporangiaceae bacterium]